MCKELDLVKILEKVPKGTKLYSLWNYIVPVDKFDFKDLTVNTEDNYGMAVG